MHKNLSFLTKTLPSLPPAPMFMIRQHCYPQLSPQYCYHRVRKKLAVAYCNSIRKTNGLSAFKLVKFTVFPHYIFTFMLLNNKSHIENTIIYFVAMHPGFQLGSNEFLERGWWNLLGSIDSSMMVPNFSKGAPKSVLHKLNHGGSWRKNPLFYSR